MNYTDVKKGQIFVEAADPAKPKRIPREVVIRTLHVYSAEIEVVLGRGTGTLLSMPLKRLTDPKQWTLRQFHAQILTKAGWISTTTGNERLLYEFETAEEAAKAIKFSYPDQFREDRLDRAMKRVRVLDTGTGEVSEAWRYV